MSEPFEPNHTCRCEKCYEYRQERDRLSAENSLWFSAVTRAVEAWEEYMDKDGQEGGRELTLAMIALSRVLQAKTPHPKGGT